MILGDQEQIGAEIRDNLNIQGEGGRKGANKAVWRSTKRNEDLGAMWARCAEISRSPEGNGQEPSIDMNGHGRDRWSTECQRRSGPGESFQAATSRSSYR